MSNGQNSILISTYTTTNGSNVKFLFEKKDNYIRHSLYTPDLDRYTYQNQNHKKLDSFFSEAASAATKVMRLENLSYDQIYIEITSSGSSDNKSYQYKVHKIAKTNKNETAFLITEDNKVVTKSVTDNEKYISRDISKYPTEVREKIEYLKNYFKEKDSELQYLEMMLKGNFTELGDPAM